MSEDTGDMVSLDMETMGKIGARIPIGGPTFGGGVRKGSR